MYQWHRSRYLFHRSLIGLLLAIGICAITGLAIWRAQGMHLLSVQTGSMIPVFQPGDALVVSHVSAQDLQIGQVVSYHSSANPQVVLSHRIVHIDKNQHVLVTKGDNTNQADAPIRLTQIIGRDRIVVPHVGTIFDYLHSKLGLLGLVYIPAVSAVIVEVRRLAKNLQRSSYYLRRHSRGAMLKV